MFEYGIASKVFPRLCHYELKLSLEYNYRV